jgi:hypothetical protein
MSTKPYIRLVLSAVVILLAACEDTSGPVAQPALEDDVALVAGSLIDGDVVAMQGQGLAGFGVPGMLFPVLRSGTPPCGGTEPCPEGHRDGRTWTRTVTFFDAAGAEQPAYDSLATASIRFQLAMSGSLANEYWSASVARAHDLVLTGLEGSETQATWNGTGSAHITRSRHEDGSVVRTYEIETTSLIEDVVVPRGTAPHWPLSGTITQQHTVTRAGPQGTVSVTRTAVITFDGTRYALLTIGERTFTIDLALRGRTRSDRD